MKTCQDYQIIYTFKYSAKELQIRTSASESLSPTAKPLLPKTASMRPKNHWRKRAERPAPKYENNMKAIVFTFVNIYIIIVYKLCN